MSIEAMKQALEALEYWAVRDEFNKDTREALDTLRTAIEQAEFDAAHEALEKQAGIHVSQQPAPVQEPSGWVNHANIASAVAERGRGGSGDTHTWSESKTAYHTVPFYTTPPAAQRQWVGLTDEDYTELGKAVAVNKHQCRAIEAKLREKNA